MTDTSDAPSAADVNPIGVDAARDALQANLDNYGRTALVQAAEIAALQKISSELSPSDQKSLANYQYGYAVSVARRDQFKAWLDALPAS